MLVTSIFMFSHNVFKSLFFQSRQKSGLCSKELKISRFANFVRRSTQVSDHDIIFRIYFSPSKTRTWRCV